MAYENSTFSTRILYLEHKTSLKAQGYALCIVSERYQNWVISIKSNAGLHLQPHV